MRAAFALALILGGVAIADVSDTPLAATKSPAAVAAMDKDSAAERRAQEIYDQAVKRARNTELGELQIALKAATRQGDLDEANSINAVMKQIEAEIPMAAITPEKPSSMEGRWKMNHNGNQFEWIITDQHVQHAGTDEAVIPMIEGNVMLLKWRSGYTDRLTFEGDRFFLEGWDPGQPTSDWPKNVCEGVRDTN
jgi:hypothetical protein